jgi:hypothetical protein
MKKINIGANFSSFLIPLKDYYNSYDRVEFKGQYCIIRKLNWVTAEVILIANNTNGIEYEIETMHWLW